MAGLDQFILGMQVALQPMNVLYCFVGVVLGTLTGVLPGFGPVTAISILLPITFYLSPTAAIIILAGIYYGAQYGGSITSILINIPGESSCVVTCLDGYQMAKQGRAGKALGIAAYGSFIGAILSIIGLMLLAPPVASAALRFGPPEYVALIVFGLSTVSLLGSGSTLKALTMAASGLLIGTIGLDPMFGQVRFNYGLVSLSDGVGLVPVVMGLFGISEILLNVSEGVQTNPTVQTEIKNLYPSIKDLMASKGAIMRGTLIGFILGCLPGGGALLASFVSYTIEKKVSKHPEKFGKGAIEGVAAPETANNAAAQSAFVPLFTLGLPSNPVTAIMLGALLIHGLTPGPLLLVQNPELFWGVIASMFLGNVMLLVLNLPLIPVWVKVLRVPYSYMFPFILLFCIIGTYTIGNNISDAILMLVFGVIGYFLKKADFEPAPLVLGLVLGPMFEKALGQSLRIAYGDPLIFFKRPISLSCLVLCGLFFLLPYLLKFKDRQTKTVLKD